MQGPPWRPSESQNEAARAQVEFATSETASLVRDHFQELAVRLGAEQAKLTEALDLYGQSIQARLNSSSVALAREFRDSGEQLSKRIEAAGEFRRRRHRPSGRGGIFAMGQSAGDVDRRMTERTREALAQIDGAVATTADAIASMSENAAARLRQVLNDISEGAAASLNQQLQQTEIHHRALAASAEGGGRALGEQAAEAAGLIESKLQGAASTLERLVDDALQRIDAKIGARVGELNERLISVERDLDRQWGERRSGVAAEFAAAADETRAAIAAAAAQVGRAANEAVNSAREDFAQSIQLSMQQLADATESSAQRVGHATDQAMQTLTRSESEITVRLDAFETAVTARAAEVGRAASEAVTSAKHDFAQSVELSVQQLADATETSAQRVGRATEQALQTLTRSESDMTARLDAFETVVTARSETISEQMAAQSLAMGGALEAMESLLGRQGRALIEALDASTTNLNDAFEARLKDADARMLAWRDAWEQAFATHVRLLEEGSRDGAASLHSLAAEHRAAAIASLEAHRASVAGDLASAFATLQEQLGAREREASANLLRVAREMADGVADELSTLVDALGTRGEGLRERIVARQAELIEVFEKGAAKTEISLSRSLGSTANSIEALATRIGQDLDRRGHAIAQTMEQTTELVLGAPDRPDGRGADVDCGRRRRRGRNVRGEPARSAVLAGAGRAGRRRGPELGRRRQSANARGAHQARRRRRLRAAQTGGDGIGGALPERGQGGVRVRHGRGGKEHILRARAAGRGAGRDRPRGRRRPVAARAGKPKGARRRDGEGGRTAGGEPGDARGRRGAGGRTLRRQRHGADGAASARHDAGRGQAAARVRRTPGGDAGARRGRWRGARRGDPRARRDARQRVVDASRPTASGLRPRRRFADGDGGGERGSVPPRFRSDRGERRRRFPVAWFRAGAKPSPAASPRCVRCWRAKDFRC